MAKTATIRAALAAAMIFITGLAAAWIYLTQFRQAEYATLDEGSMEIGTIRGFIDSYFSTWSASDWDGYADHFHEDAVIYSHRKAGLRRLEKARFIQMQTAAVSNSKVPLREVAEKVVVESDGNSASVIAYWKLYRGIDTSTGVDRFTLAFDAGEDRWQIVTLYWR